MSADPQVCSTAVSPMRAEMLGVGCNGDQGLGRDLEQQAIDDRLVVIGDVGDRSRQVKTTWK